MNNANVDIIKTAIQIGDHSKRISVVGKDIAATKKNLLSLFAKKNDRKTTNN